MSSQPNLSIIVPTFTSAESLPFKSNIDESDLDIEIVTPNDPTLAKARNRGVKEAESDFLVFLDDDSYPSEDYFINVASALRQHPAVSGKIIDIGWLNSGSVYPPGNERDELHVCQSATGCNMAFRREVFDTIGLFDTRLPYGHGETEFVDRVTEEFDVWYHPEVEIEHPYVYGFRDYVSKEYRHGRERIYYWLLRDENPLNRVTTEAQKVHGFGRTLPETFIEGCADVARISGYITGIILLKMGYDRGIT